MLTEAITLSLSGIPIQHHFCVILSLPRKIRSIGQRVADAGVHMGQGGGAPL